jgi:hypothetical protein
MNNFYLYRRENTNQHVVIPWDDDNAFRSEDWPIFAGVDDNVLTANAIRVPELESAYVTALRDAVREMERAVDGANMSWFEYEMRRQLDLIADAMREDPAKPYSYDEHQSVREEMIAYARNRTGHVREQLSRHGFGAAP